MDGNQFWRCIETARGDRDCADEQALEEQLSALSLEDLCSFQEHFDQLHDLAYRWDLWGAAYLIQGGCSDDGFTYFRYGLLAFGQARFERALANPDTLVEVNDEIANEMFGYVACQLIEKNGGDMNDERFARVRSEPVGDKWNFEDSAEMRRRFPRLWERYAW